MRAVAFRKRLVFVNTDGGVIYVGIDDQGNVTGIDNVDDTYTRITNGIRDAIRPDVTMFVRYVLQEDEVIRIEIGEGSFKPYYFENKGTEIFRSIRASGSFQCSGIQEQIRQMMKEADGDVYEDMRAILQDLSFEETKAAFDRYGVDFSEDKYITVCLSADGWRICLSEAV